MEIYTGNYRQSRYDWSQRARTERLKELSRPKENLNDNPSFSKLLNHFEKEYQSQAIRMLGQLIIDVYQLNVLPTYIVDSFSYTTSYLLAHDLNIVFCELGDLSVTCSSYLKGDIKIGKNIYLTKKAVGMPVKDFLVWYKGSLVSSIVISEWSGIEPQQLIYVYKAIVNYFQSFLRSVHSYERKYSKKPPIPTLKFGNLKDDQI